MFLSLCGLPFTLHVQMSHHFCYFSNMWQVEEPQGPIHFKVDQLANLPKYQLKTCKILSYVLIGLRSCGLVNSYEAMGRNNKKGMPVFALTS